MSCAGNVGPEQQSTGDILDFLSQTSDADNFGSVHSEPEAETQIMSCYHGVYANGAVRQCEMSGTEQRAQTSKYAFFTMNILGKSAQACLVFLSAIALFFP